MSPSVLGSQPTKAIPTKKQTNSKKKGWKKPKDKPKRPLSAYNLFFQHERDLMLRSVPSPFGHSHADHHSTLGHPPSVRRDRSKRVRPPPHGKIGFAELAKQIGQKWKSLDAENRAHFESLAAIEKSRYNREVEVWQKKKNAQDAGLNIADLGGDSQEALPTQKHNERMYEVLSRASEISQGMSYPAIPEAPPSANIPYVGEISREYTNSSFLNMHNVQQHSWAPNFNLPDASTCMAKMISVKHDHNAPPLPGMSGLGHRVQDNDILDFLSRLVSD